MAKRAHTRRIANGVFTVKKYLPGIVTGIAAAYLFAVLSKRVKLPGV